MGVKTWEKGKVPVLTAKRQRRVGKRPGEAGTGQEEGGKSRKQSWLGWLEDAEA